MQRCGEPARQQQRGKEVELEHLAPVVEAAVERAQALLEAGLGRGPGVVDQGVHRAAAERLVGLGDEGVDAVAVRQVGGDVAMGYLADLALDRDVLARTGDDAPARPGKADHGLVADAAAGSGDDDGAHAFGGHWEFQR